MPALPATPPSSPLHHLSNLLRRAHHDHGNHAKPRSFSPGVLFVFCLLGASLGLLAWWLFIRQGGFFWKPWDWADYKASVLRKPERRPDDALTVFSDGTVRRAGSSVAGSSVGPARTVVLGELDTTYQKSFVVPNEKGYEETRAERRARRQALKAQRQAQRYNDEGSAWGSTITRSLWGRLRGGNASEVHRHQPLDVDDDDDNDTFLQREKSLTRARDRYADDPNPGDLGTSDISSYVDEPAAPPLQSVVGHSELSSSMPNSHPQRSTKNTRPPPTAAAINRMASYARGDDGAAPPSRAQSFARGDDGAVPQKTRQSQSRSRHNSIDTPLTRKETKRPMGARAPTQKHKSRESSRNRESGYAVYETKSYQHQQQQKRKSNASSSSAAAPRASGERTRERERERERERTREKEKQRDRPRRSSTHHSSRRDSSSPHKSSSRHHSTSRHQSRSPTKKPPSPTKPSAASSSHHYAPTRPAPTPSDSDSDSDSDSSDEASELNPSEIGLAKGNKTYHHTLSLDPAIAARAAAAPAGATVVASPGTARNLASRDRGGRGSTIAAAAVGGNGGNERGLVLRGENSVVRANGGGGGGGGNGNEMGIVRLGKGYRRGSGGSLSSVGSVGSSNAGR